MSIFRRPAGAEAAGDAIPLAADGVVHLFCGSSPKGTVDYPDRVRTTWYHQTTSDFTTWVEHGPTLGPGAPGTVDGSGVWTGSVVEHDGTYYLFYTGFNLGAENPQTICLATSTDLLTFRKSELNPLLAPIAGFEPVDWRDPYVFYNEDEGRWWMVFAARLAQGPHWRRGCVMLATSDDLMAWKVEPEPLYVPGTTFCPECPELWSAGGRWYLVFSRFSEDAGTVYRVADTARGPFRIPSDDELGGRRWYAAKSADLGDGSRVFFGWVHDMVADGTRPRWLWGGDFTAARRVTARDDGTLAVSLIPAVRQGFGQVLEEATVPADARGASDHRTLVPTLPRTALIEWCPQWEEQPPLAGLYLSEDDALAGWYLTLDRRQGKVTLAHEPRPLDDFWADLTHRTDQHREVDGPVAASAMLPDRIADGVDVTVLIDDEIVEVYVGDVVALTHRIQRRRRLGLGVFTVDGAVQHGVTVRIP